MGEAGEGAGEGVDVRKTQMVNVREKKKRKGGDSPVCGGQDVESERAVCSDAKRERAGEDAVKGEGREWRRKRAGRVG